MADIKIEGNKFLTSRQAYRMRGFVVRAVVSLLTVSLLLIPSPIQDQNTVFAEELPAPLFMADSSPVQYISVGRYHSCGIKPDGSVACWGQGLSGQLDVPAPNSGFTQISLGFNHSCGLKSDGSIVCWGSNTSGQTTVPPPNNNFVQVSAGRIHTCGLKNDNSVVCWGDNSSNKSTVPAPNNDFQVVSAGSDHSCGLLGDGSLVCWGSNSQGQVNIPAPNTNFVGVSAGGDHTCGLKDDNTLACWGRSFEGQTTIPAPNADFTFVSTGVWHTCARKKDGSVRCWGYNADGQSSVPAPNADFVQLSANQFHTCGLKGDGSFVCWGRDDEGQVNPNLFYSISAGGYHTCGVNKSGSVLCWGQNTDNQLTPPSPNTNFKQVSAGQYHTCGLKFNDSIVCWGGTPFYFYGTVPTPNSNYSRVSAGTTHSCAVKNDNTLVCWPESWYTFAPSPPNPPNQYYAVDAGVVQTCAITTPGHIMDCWGVADPVPNSGFYYEPASGDGFACGIKSDSSIECWGDNTYGQTDAPPVTNFEEVSAGREHACGRTAWPTYTAYCWGRNNYGQATVPSPPFSFRSIDAGHYHTCGLYMDFSFSCWGRNNAGQSNQYLTTLKVPPSLYPPTAVDDNYSTLEDTPLIVNSANGVLANDTDFDSPVLTAHKDSDPPQGTAALAADGSFSYDPTVDICGPDSYTYHAEDGTSSSNSATVNLTVTCLNDPPSFSASSPPAVLEDSPLQTISGWASFTSPGPPDEAGQTLLGYIVSNISDPGLFSQAPSVSPTGTLTYQPAADQYGISTFDVQVQDNGGTANGGVDISPAQTFTITVNPINDQPDFTASDPPAVSEDAPLQTIPGWATFDPGPTNEAGQSVLAYTVSNISYPGLFSTVPAVSAAGTLTYQPASNQNGSSTFDILVQDDGSTANGGLDTGPIHTFTIQVNSVNDPPTTTGLGSLSVVEDTPGNAIDAWLYYSDTEDSDLQLSFTLESYTNPGLFNLVYINSDRYLMMSYVADEFGTSTVTVRATDTGSLFVESDLSLEIRPVNDAPSFTPGGNVTVPMNSGAYSAAWASSISAGPSNESGQTLTFTISNDNNGLFTVQPDLSLAGVLSFTPVAGLTGSAQVSVTLSDDGGTTDGGVDTSPTEVFTITVGPFPTVTMVRAEGGPGIFPGATVIDWIDDISISFDLVMDNPPGNGDPDDVTNPDNYLLVEAGLDGVFNTTSCLAGLAGDDVQITVDWIQYPYWGTYARLFLNGGISLPSGEYRLFACGSTSLTAGGIALAGDGATSGTDYSLDFSVIRPDRLPDTGFPPGIITPLTQGETGLYTDSGLVLEIPHLDLSLPITGIPFQENTWNVKYLAGRIGWLEGTAFPTWAGNSVLTGHVVGASGMPGPFANLNSLGYGDRILVKGWGQSYIYEVQSVKTLAADDISKALGHEDYPWLTLTTCSGYSTWQESYSSRIVVKAVQIGIR